MAKKLSQDYLDDEVSTLASNILDELFVCHRVWLAWETGTMRESDFSLANEDENTFNYTKQAILDFINRIIHEQTT